MSKTEVKRVSIKRHIPESNQKYPNKSNIVVRKPINGNYDVVGKGGFVLDYYVTYDEQEFYVIWVDGMNSAISVPPNYIRGENEEDWEDEQEVQKQDDSYENFIQ